MILRLYESKDINYSEMINSCYKRKLLSNFMSYGMAYQFVKFFKVITKLNSAYICLYNSSMVMALCIPYCDNDEDFDNELKTFISLNCPYHIEVDRSLADKMSDYLGESYSVCERQLYAYKNKSNGKIINVNDDVNDNPRLDDVYKILESSFDDMQNCYELWITDTSHRIRHGVSKVYLLDGKVTLSADYVIDNHCCISKVATLPMYRNEGLARSLIIYICNKMHNDNITTELFALPHMLVFYEKLGFQKVLKDKLFERVT